LNINFINLIPYVEKFIFVEISSNSSDDNDDSDDDKTYEPFTRKNSPDLLLSMYYNI